MVVAKADARDLDSLLHLALSRPMDALAEARRIKAESMDPLVLSYALQASGIVLRDSGDTSGAIAELRAAVREARRTGHANREADVRATMGAALAMHGLTTDGLAQLDLAASSAHGSVLAKVLIRRAYVWTMIGRHRAALTDMQRAVAGIRRQGDEVWIARALMIRGHILSSLGEVTAAERDFTAAGRVFRSEGQELEWATTVHNRAALAYFRGDLPTALSVYDEAGRLYDELGIRWPDLDRERVELLLAAGLDKDAHRVATEALAGESLSQRHESELHLIAAVACLATDNSAAAMKSATQARILFRRQQRQWWADRAELLIARIKHQNGNHTNRLLTSLEAVAERMDEARDEQATDAWLLCGRIADARGISGHGYYQSAAKRRDTGSGIARTAGWLALALDRANAGNTRGVLSACSSGLDALDENLTAWGSSEMRALGTMHGRELAALALRRAARDGDARTLLRWTERWRATALAQPAVKPPKDRELASLLAALRANAQRLAEARAEGGPTGVLEQERARLERAIRSKRLTAQGGGVARERFRVERLVGELDDQALIELVDVDGQLQALVVRNGRVRRFEVGPMDEALRAVEFARFALRQAARGRPVDLSTVGPRLQDALLGTAAKALGDGPVVVVPPSTLYAAPWPLVPALACLPVSTVPSAALWLRAKALRPRGRKVALIAGPDLPTGGAEVPILAKLTPGAVVLTEAAATVAACLKALDGARLAHIAAHGRHRQDNPMFSSLDVHDGPLTVHDLEGLRRAPYRVVLSACVSGVMKPVGADELLGLGTALLSLGGAGIVSSVAEVDDEATVALMLDLHAHLSDGQDLAHAMLGARAAAKGDRMREAAAAAFAAVGV